MSSPLSPPHIVPSPDARRARPRFLGALLAVAFLSLTGFGGGYYYTSRPSYALVRLGTAVLTHDSATAYRYLDAKATAAHLVEGFTSSVSDEMLESKEAQSGFGMLGQALAVTMLEKMKPMMVKKVELELRHAIVGTAVGRPGGLLDVGSPESGSASPVWLRQLTGTVAGAGTRTLSFTGFGATTVHGDSATVEVRLRHNDLDTALVVRVAMAKGDGAWRVVGIPNLVETLHVVEGTEALRLAAANAPVINRMRHTAAIGAYQANLVSLDDYGFRQRLRFRMPVANRGRVPITDMAVRLEEIGKAKDSDPQYLFLLDTLAPGKTGELVGSLDYNQFMERHTMLRYSPERFTPRVVMIVTGRDTIAPFSSWAAYRGKFPAIPASH